MKPAIRLSEIIIKRNSASRNRDEFSKEESDLTYEILRWRDNVDPNHLYQMSLIGHLIDIIEKEGNGATLAQLLEKTDPYIQYLRNLNGKQVKGKLEKIVKGGLSGKQFMESNIDNKWHIVEQRVKEFKKDANIKFRKFLEKEGQKKKQSQNNQKKNTQQQHVEEDHSQNQVKKEMPQQNLQLGWDEFLNSMSDSILKNLNKINQQQKIDDRFLGILIAYKKMENRLDHCYGKLEDQPIKIKRNDI